MTTVLRRYQILTTEEKLTTEARRKPERFTTEDAKERKGGFVRFVLAICQLPIAVCGIAGGFRDAKALTLHPGFNFQITYGRRAGADPGGIISGSCE